MRKRSAYRPKGVRLDNMSWVKSGLQRLVSLTNENFVVRTKNHAAMRAITTGVGTKDDADIMIAALNMTEALAKLRIGDDWSSEIRAGQVALLALCRRYMDIRRFVFKAEELTAVNLAMEIHDAQLDACTVQELERAMDIVTRVKQSGQAIQIGEFA
jgi:hypothetical protein